MTLSRDKNILIVGLGLLGGSYAMALTRKDYHVRAICHSDATLEYALEHRLIKQAVQ